MDRQAVVVHLVVARRNGLYHALHGGLGAVARLRLWEVPPRAAMIGTGHSAVVDLADPPLSLTPRDLLPALDRADVLLVVGERPVHPGWFETIKHPRVSVVPCGAPGRESGFQSVVAAVLARFRGPSAEKVAAMVVAAEPTLQCLQSYVRAVCEHPWRVRRPRDLATVVGEPTARVKWQCREQGFTRVEHFIVCVRAIALELVSRGAGISVAAARSAVGFDDPSNMRRHLGRALQRSPRAAGRLLSLAGAPP